MWTYANNDFKNSNNKQFRKWTLFQINSHINKQSSWTNIFFSFSVCPFLQPNSLTLTLSLSDTHTHMLTQSSNKSGKKKIMKYFLLYKVYQKGVILQICIKSL